jgi:hypothetical protein
LASASSDPVDVDLGRLEGDARLAQLGRLGHDPGHVQERFGGDAADVQADAAQLLAAVDQGDAEAEIGRTERRRVTARATTQDGHLNADVGRRRGLRRRVGTLEREQDRAFGDLVADGDGDVGDLARLRRGHFHRRLVGLEHDQGILDRDLIPHGHEYLDHGYRVEIPDVRDLDLHQSSTLRRSDSCWTRCATKRAASAPSMTRWS